MFTSRLPVATGSKRTDGSTSFVGDRQRASNIPNTVKKLNLFTPQTKRPMSVGGASTSSKSFLNTDKKFQRPSKAVPDRDAQIKMFDRVMDYIKSHSTLPVPDAKRFFSSVSTTETTRLFEYLIGRLLPDFKITRLEKDVPEALALLDYPYIRSVTKSSLVSVTTRQAAVGLLVIFDWLLEGIEALDAGLLTFLAELEPTDKLKLHMNRIRGMSREESINAVLAESYPKVDIDRKMAELAEVDNQLQILNAKMENAQEIKLTKMALRDDIKKCQEYNEQMRRHIKSKKEYMEECKQKSLQLKMNTAELHKQRDHVLMKIRNHELTVEDAQQEKKLHEQLRTKLSHIRKQKQSTKAEIELLESKNKELLDRCRNDERDLIDKFKQLSDIFENQLADFNCDQVIKRREIFKEWIPKLEDLMLEHDPAKHLSVQHELRLLAQKLHGSESTLQAELQDCVRESKRSVDEILAENQRKLQDLTIKQEKLKRLDHDIEREQARHIDEKRRLQTLIDKRSAEFIELQAKLSTERDNLLKEVEAKQQRLDKIRRDSVEFVKLRMDYIKCLTERGLIECQNIAIRSEQRSNSLAEVNRVAEENARVVRVAKKRLKKKLHLKD